MSFFRTRGGAVLILIAAIVLSTMYGVNRSLGNQVVKIERAFFTDSYVMKNVEKNKKSSLDLIYVAENYHELAEKTALLKSARNALADAWDAQTDAKAVAAANRALNEAAEDLYRDMQTLQLSESDAKYADENIDYIRNATRVLKSGTEYSRTAQEFNLQVMNAFPAKYLKYVGFVEEAALF